MGRVGLPYFTCAFFVTRPFTTYHRFLPSDLDLEVLLTFQKLIDLEVFIITFQKLLDLEVLLTFQKLLDLDVLFTFQKL